MSHKNQQSGFILISVIILAVAVLIIAFFIPNFTSTQEIQEQELAKHASNKDGAQVLEAGEQGNVQPGQPAGGEVLGLTSENTVSHVTIPKSVKAVYMSSWVGGTESLRSKIIQLIDDTELNAVILDIKDYTGMLSFDPQSTHLEDIGCIDERIKDLPELIKRLHDKNIYVIGRVAVFQDPCMVKYMPDQAVKRKSDGAVWKDKNGISWMDAGSQKVWDYNIEIARAAYALGFDEINFDYIRYPSDGNMIDISFPISGNRDKQETLQGFFAHIDKELRGGRAVAGKRVSATSSALGFTPAQDPAFDDLVAQYGLQISTTSASVADISLDGKKVETAPKDAPRLIVSADLFGMVTNNTDDLGIGQVLERAAPYLDFIGPMVYPSHYPNNYIGYSNPAAYPYQIVKHAMNGGVAKLRAIHLNPLKLRPWLQDFNLGATYTADMVRKQIQATYDVGLTGWMLWDASNTYTPGGALKLK